MKIYPSKRSRLILLLPLLIFTFAPAAFAQTESPSSRGPNKPLGPDSKESGFKSRPSKTSHKASKKHRHKSRKSVSTGEQSGNGSQEDVTDQREVSQQADQTKYHKK